MRNEMNTTIESEKNAAAADVSQPEAKHAAKKKAKPAKKAVRAKRPTSRPTGDHANKKAEVIVLMKRARGVALAEIMSATKWQTHTVRGLRQHPRQQGRREDRVVEERRRGAHVQDRQVATGAVSSI
jgi:hypothetical protein